MTNMSDYSTEKSLEIIEVPPELRGPSDEEILKMSEKKLREVSGKRKKGERRPSKRARLAMKREKELLEARNLAMEVFGNSKNVKAEETPNFKNLSSHPQDKQEFIRNAFTEKSPGYNVFYNKQTTPSSNESIAEKSVPKIVEPTTPASGRVLKASFGIKTSEKPKATIVSAADLARQRAEERAKKIREALLAKRTPAIQSPVAENLNENGEPVKRPRGRPRKNPLAES